MKSQGWICLIFLWTETGTAIRVIGQDHKAEANARPLLALRLPGEEKMGGSIASPALEPVRQRQRLFVLEPDGRRLVFCRRTSLTQRSRSLWWTRWTWNPWCFHHSAVRLGRCTSQGLLLK